MSSLVGYDEENSLGSTINIFTGRRMYCTKIILGVTLTKSNSLHHPSSPVVFLLSFAMFDKTAGEYDSSIKTTNRIVINTPDAVKNHSDHRQP
jgi:hypothetical protein